MVHQQLIEYINAQIQLGKSSQDIHAQLLTSGWDEATIAENYPLAVLAGAPPKNSFLSRFHFRRRMSPLVIAIILFSVSVTAVLGYTIYARQPLVVLSRSADKLRSIKSLAYDVSMSFTIGNTDKTAPYLGTLGISPKDFMFTMAGKVDDTDEKHMKSSSRLHIGIPVSKTKIWKLTLNAITLNKLYYVMLSEFPKNPLVRMDGIINTWIKME